jgi:hypothetical protein
MSVTGTDRACLQHGCADDKKFPARSELLLNQSLSAHVGVPAFAIADGLHTSVHQIAERSFETAGELLGF